MFRFCTENSIEEKVIEKAYKKLRLDALVIQQGRLTDSAGTKVGLAGGRLACGRFVPRVAARLVACGRSVMARG